MKNIAYVIIALGVLALIYTGYSYTTKEKVVDLGAVEITQERKHTLNWPPIAGFLLILGGVGLLMMDKKGKSII